MALLTKTFTMNQSFSSNIINMIDKDLKLNFLKKKTSEKKDEDL